MKTDKIYTMDWLVAVLLLLTACNADNQQPDVMSADLLRVGNNIEVSGGESIDTIHVEANCNWTVRTQDSWIHIVSPRDGNGSGYQDLILNVEASTQTTAKTGKLYLTTADGIQRVIGVTQRPGDGFITIDPASDVVFAYSGGEESITVTSNVQWTATSSSPWLTINGQQEVTAEGEQILTLRASANAGMERLRGSITFRDQDKRVSPVVKIVEVGGRTPHLEVIPDSKQSITVPALGGVSTFAVSSNFDWQATLELQPSGSWAHFANGEFFYSGRANNDFFSIELTLDSLPSQQERTVVVTFKTVSDGSNNLQEKRTIIQEAGTLPDISNVAYSNITHTTATIAFEQRSSTFGITACGVRYSTSEANVQSGDYEEGAVQDAVTINLKDLTPNTLYYVCAYATNAVGTRFSDVISFQTRSVPGREDNEEPEVE